MGKSAILGEVHRVLGGALLSAGDLVVRMRGRDPLSVEETFDELLLEALLAHDLVLFDDLDIVSGMTGGCTPYQRQGLLEAPLRRLADRAEEAGKKLVFACRGGLPRPLWSRADSIGIPDFTPGDYAFLCRTFLGPRAGKLDQGKIHRFAPGLDVHDLRDACAWLARSGPVDTDRFIDYLRARHLASNAELKEVQKVELTALRGLDDVIEALEDQIILPLENDEISTRLRLRPKRGVLLSGPPGTGKTTVGRALAHRLKSKFFLIDGEVIAGTDHFYGQVDQIFRQAKRNAPSVVFIDDGDVMFHGGESGFYRYLLSFLDGVESEAASRVCVILTAMDVGRLPPALVRSGRIELWLEMPLPDEAAREAILRGLLADQPEEMGDAEDVGTLAGATEGFTGADLKRLVDDGKLLLARDLVRGRPARPAGEYLLSAAGTLTETRRRFRKD